MNEFEYDWSRFNINYYYPANLEKVFSLWATRQGLRSFLVEECYIEGREDSEIVKTNDQFTLTWRQGYSVKGDFLEVQENKLLSFSFGNMRIDIIFKPRGQKTLVSLHQSLIPSDERGKVMGHLNSRSSWAFYMTNLKSVILTGTDLRETEKEIASAYEVGFEPKELKLP